MIHFDVKPILKNKPYQSYKIYTDKGVYNLAQYNVIQRTRAQKQLKSQGTEVVK